MVREAAIERTETRQFFEMNRELRELRAADRPDKKQLKAVILEDLETLGVCTTQPSLAARCRKLLAEFEYVREELAANAQLKTGRK